MLQFLLIGAVSGPMKGVANPYRGCYGNDMEEETPLQKKLKEQIAIADMPLSVFAKLIGASDTSLDYWLKGDRIPIDTVTILLEYMEERPEFMTWLKARYERKYGHAPRKKGAAAPPPKPRRKVVKEAHTSPTLMRSLEILMGEDKE